MSGFNDPYPSYEHLAHHSEEEGKKKRRKLWNVFWIMLGITIGELIIGFQAEAWGLNKTVLMYLFITLTVVKAGFIVLSFMHLGDETKAYKWVILGPYTVFILYLAIMVDIGEGNYSKEHRADMDKAFAEQREEGHKHLSEEHKTSEEHKDGAKEETKEVEAHH